MQHNLLYSLYSHYGHHYDAPSFLDLCWSFLQIPIEYNANNQSFKVMYGLNAIPLLEMYRMHLYKPLI